MQKYYLLVIKTLYIEYISEISFKSLYKKIISKNCDIN